MFCGSSSVCNRADFAEVQVPQVTDFGNPPARRSTAWRRPFGGLAMFNSRFQPCATVVVAVTVAPAASTTEVDVTVTTGGTMVVVEAGERSACVS